jgi:3-oxoacyl-[acyl-carrier protein] reductase
MTAAGLLEGKHVVVTGASRGLGRAIAIACAREGATLGLAFHSRAAEAESVARLVEERFGRRSVLLGFDHTDAGAVENAARRAADELGGIDAWVNNASENLGGLFVASDAERLRQQIEVALVGPMLCARAAIEIMMRQKSGVLLNVSSVAAVRPARGQAAYAAAKGGLEALTRALSVEYAKKGIRVVGLRPGAIDTEMLASTKQLAEDEIIARIPARRVASAEEVAEHAVFLLSDRAAYATGSIVTVDGGYAVG